MLLIGIEKATRLLGHLALTEKEYAATIRLGQSTITDDADGEVRPAQGHQDRPASAISAAALRAGLAALTGPIIQVPPKISAIKVDGKRAYHLTRSGADPQLAGRTVTVSQLDLLAIRTAGDLLDVDVMVTCSSGTYIRAIARDLGEALGVGGHLTALRRTRVGPYVISEARTLDQLAATFEVIPLALAAQAAFPSVRLTAEQARLVSHGVRLPAAGIAADCAAFAQADGSPGAKAGAGQGSGIAHDGPIAALGPDGMLIALLARKDEELASLAVFVT